MALRPALAILVTLALVSPSWADDLDDLDLGGPPSPASAAPAAPAAPGKVDEDDPFKDDDVLGKQTGPSVLEPSAPTALPGGLRDAWNLVAALAALHESKLDNRPKDPPFKSWQALRVSQELSAILNGATDVPGPLKSLIERRMSGLLGRAVEETILDDLQLDGVPKPAAAAPAATEAPAPGLDEEVEALAHKLAVLDRSDLALAQDVAKRLAEKAGDASMGTRLAAAAVHGPELVAFTDRMRALVHVSPGAPWVIAQLASGDPGRVQAALDFVRDGAGLGEVRAVLGAVAEGKIGDGAAAQVVQSVGASGTDELVPDLERLTAPALGRAVGEALGRIRQRADELASWRDASSSRDRAEAASRLNQAALPLFRAGSYREALLKFRAACELDATVATYQYNHGSALVRLGNVADGLERLKAAIAIGSDEMAYYEAATAAMRDLGKRAELMTYLEERAPRVQYSAVVVLLYLNLAHEYIAAGRPTEAHQALDIAFSRAVPEKYMTALLARRGDAFMLAGDVAQARRTYQRALEYAPEYRRALDGMLRADAWQPAGGASVGAPAPAPVDDTGLNLELDAPSPKASNAAPPAAPAPAAPAPKPVASPLGDGLDDLEI